MQGAALGHVGWAVASFYSHVFISIEGPIRSYFCQKGLLEKNKLGGGESQTVEIVP